MTLAEVNGEPGPPAYDFDLDTREHKLIHEEEVLGGFDRNNYETERVFATARDGTAVPVSLVYRLPLERGGARPLLLQGYGSYGYSFDPAFSSNALSLLDRGWIVAIAHIRGLGYDLVDVDTSNEHWKEAFLRPKQAHGTLIQVAQSSASDEVTARHLRPSNLDELLG